MQSHALKKMIFSKKTIKNDSIQIELFSLPSRHFQSFPTLLNYRSKVSAPFELKLTIFLAEIFVNHSIIKFETHLSNLIYV